MWFYLDFFLNFDFKFSQRGKKWLKDFFLIFRLTFINFFGHHCMKAVFLNIMQFISPFYDENWTFVYIFFIQKQWTVNNLTVTKRVVTHIWPLPFIYIFVFNRCPELGVLLWYQLELLYSLPKKIWVGPSAPIFVTFLLFIIEKIVKSKYVEFDFNIGHTLVIFLFSWIIQIIQYTKNVRWIMYSQKGLRKSEYPFWWYSGRSEYLWCTFVCVTYTAECIGERAGGQNCADRLQRCFW